MNELRPFEPRRTLLALAACLGLGAATTGCYVVTDNGGTAPLPPATPAGEETVDTNATMVVAPGAGTGLFVEYLTGGQWNVYTTCDTDITNEPCSFDVIVSVPDGVTMEEPKFVGDHEPVDSIELVSGGFRMLTGTALGQDGVSFVASPGAPITIDMLLDGFAQPQFINWVSGGFHEQDPGVNPVQFTPSAE